MFRGGKKDNALLFEYVVFHMLVSRFKWTVFKDGQGWVERDFKFSSGKVVACYDENALKNMQTGVLYRPVDPEFPAVDMVWAEVNNLGQKVYFGIQVTLGKTHPKRKTVYEELYVRLGLNKEERFIVYTVTNPVYAESYAKLKREQYFKPQLRQSTDFPYNLEFATIRAKEFDDRLYKL